MTRRLLNLLTALSLLLCVAVAALWVRSYFHSDAWTYGRIAFQGTATAASTRGEAPVQSQL